MLSLCIDINKNLYPSTSYVFLALVGIVYTKIRLSLTIQENYTAPRMVLVASGVEPDELISVAEPLLSDLPSVSRPDKPKSVYIGGDYRCQGESGVCIINIPFKFFSPVLLIKNNFFPLVFTFI